MNDVVLSLSGGLDSCVLLWQLREMSSVNKIRCISINYGQRHSIELEAANRITKEAKVEHQIIDLGAIKPLLTGSSQTDSIDVPEGHYAAENMKLTVVPNRNMILLSLAAAWAISSRSNIVAYAAHAGDHQIYPDCRPEFVSRMADVLNLCDWYRISLWVPFKDIDKAQIIKKGIILGVPFHLTSTCYKGRDLACGRCGACIERLSSFAQIGSIDPIEYEDREYYKTIMNIT